MMKWFCLFLFYSFSGYLLEKLFAWVTRAKHRVRKCFLLLPLCPVYGLAMLAANGLYRPGESFALTAMTAGCACTAVEYGVHFLYEKLLGVAFWDYSGTHLDLHGRICFPFSVAWGLLAAVSLRHLQPGLETLAGLLPPQAALAVGLLLLGDGAVSVRLLRRSGDIDLLGLGNLRRALRQE